MMKKSQILAAAALATAAGVVTPVVSAQNASATISGAANAAHGVATCPDATKVATSIKKNHRYLNAVDFSKAAKDVTAAGKAVTAGDVLDKIEDINTAYDDVKVLVNRYGNQFISTKMTTTLNNINNTNNVATDSVVTLDNLEAIIDAVEHTRGYTELRAIYDAIKAGNSDMFEAAVPDYNSVVTPNITNASATWTNIVAFQATHPYAEFKALFEAVDAANDDVITPYAQSYRDLTGAWARMSMPTAGQITPDGALAYRNNVTNKNFVKLGTLAGLGYNTTTDEFNVDNVANAAALDSLIKDTLPAIEFCNVNDEDGTIYTNILAAARDYGLINGIPVATSAQQLALALALANDSYDENAAPKPGISDVPTATTPGTANNNNTNAAANTATDAPNTGALSTAEGTATTVSIVAGLATALTALGAGVVAYRNARRSE